MKSVDLVRLLPGVLMFGLSLSNARADGGIIRLREAKGPFVVTIFAAAEPVQEGPCDVSVLVQRRDSGDAILDATVDLLLTRPPLSGAKPIGQLCGLPGVGLQGQKPGQGARPSSVQATRAQASNKLLYAAPIRFGVPGNWTLDAIVTRGSDSARASCLIAVGPPAARLIGLLPYLLLPPLIVILFAINQSLRKAP
jgi:hypothetical protein